MGDNELWHRIMGTAQALRRSAAELRSSGAAKELADMLRDPERELDVDDRENLALLIQGLLNRQRGDRGSNVRNRKIHAAERDARSRAKADGVSLDRAAERVAAKHGVKPATLIVKLRRSKKPSKTKPSK